MANESRWSERVDESSSYCVAPDARTAALKPGCRRWKGGSPMRVHRSVRGWGGGAGATLDLFGRNIAEVRYALTDMARQLFSERRCFADKQLEAEVDGESMLPPAQEVAYGGGAVVFAASQRMVRGRGARKRGRWRYRRICRCFCIPAAGAETEGDVLYDGISWMGLAEIRGHLGFVGVEYGSSRHRLAARSGVRCALGRMARCAASAVPQNAR